MIVTYTADDFAGNEVSITIDRDICTEEVLTELNNHWSDAKSRVRDALGDVEKAYVQFLANMCIRIQIEKGYNSYGVMNYFKDAEGFIPMDGSKGILISSVSVPDLDLTCYDPDEVAEMPAKPRGNF